MSQVVRIGGVTWTDGRLSGDEEEVTRIHAFLEPHGDAPLPAFGNGPWVEPSLRDPFGFIAVAQVALGVSQWDTEGVDWPAFARNPSDQSDVVA